MSPFPTLLYPNFMQLSSACDAGIQRPDAERKQTDTQNHLSVAYVSYQKPSSFLPKVKWIAVTQTAR